MNRDKNPAFTPESKSRIRSMIKESLNSAFVICNIDFETFGKEEFTDIFNQILPTAIVLNTGYWPFYEFSVKKRLRLCVCHQFMLQCRHKLAEHHSGSHQIDLPKELSKRKFSQDNGVVRPYKYRIQMLETLPQLPAGYSLSLRIVSRFVTSDRRSKVIETEYFDINERYTVLQQCEQIKISNYNFPPSSILEERFTNVLNCVEWFNFDQRIKNGFKIKSNEMLTWTLCATNVLHNRMRNDPFSLPNKQMEISKKDRKKKVNLNNKIIGSKSNPDRNDDISIDILVKLQNLLELPNDREVNELIRNIKGECSDKSTQVKKLLNIFKLSNDMKLKELLCNGKYESSEKSIQEICHS